MLAASEAEDVDGEIAGKGDETLFVLAEKSSTNRGEGPRLEACDAQSQLMN